MLAAVLLAACTKEPPTPPDSGSHATPAPTSPAGYAPAVRTPQGAPPSRFDPRPRNVIDRAACTGPNGEWRCVGVPKPTSWNLDEIFEDTAWAQTRPASTPPSWTVQQWYIDPANSSGCAADTNTGTAPGTCTHGVGPLLTFSEISARWGTYDPTLTCANCVYGIEIMSSQSNTQCVTDVLFAHPYLGGGNTGSDSGPYGGAFLNIYGIPTGASTATIGSLIAKNRSTPQPLNVTLSVGSFASQALVVNNTHPSTAWSISTGATSDITQPLAVTTLNSFGATEVDTWAVGDSLTIQTFPRFAIKEAYPHIRLKGHGEYSGVQINDLVLAGLCGATGEQENMGDSSTVFGSSTNIYDTWIETKARVWNVDDKNGVGVQHGSANVWYGGSFSGGLGATSVVTSTGTQIQGWSILGGYVAPGTSGTEFTAFQGVLLDGDVRIKSGQTVQFVGGLNFLGAVENDSTTFRINSGTLDVQTAGGTVGATPSYVVWGTGTVDSGRGFVYYPTGSTSGSTTFLETIKAANNTVGCLVNPAASTTTFTCNLACASGANLDTSLGSVSGCLGSNSSGFCNTGY